jgi:plastocyanin
MTRIARPVLAASIAAVLAAAVFAVPASSSQGETATHAALIEGFVFDPEVIAVRTGDVVTWTNRDIVPHTVTAEDGSWDSGEIGPGESWTMVVAANTASDYFCVYHPGMRARFDQAQQ